MTDQELIKALREDAPRIGWLGWGRPNDVGKKMADAADRMEALLAENEHLREVTKMMPKWRPVSEPPKEYRDEYGELKCFLVCAENCSQPFRAVYDGKNWGDGWNVLDVTHWMPLPEPPSTEGVE